MKGTEDLGGGYKAIFALEAFFRAQGGQAGRFTGDTFFARNSYVGIQSPYGTITAGRQTTQLFVSTILFNPFIDSYTFSPRFCRNKGGGASKGDMKCSAYLANE